MKNAMLGALQRRVLPSTGFSVWIRAAAPVPRSHAKACARRSAALKRGSVISRWLEALQRRALPSTGFSLCILLTAAAPAHAQAPDRSKPPVLGPPPALRLPAITPYRLSNGLQVLVLEKHEVPLVQINIVIKAGSAMDPEGKSGLASMTAAMLDEGAGGRDALALADAVDFLGADLSVTPEQHATTIAIQAPVTRLDSMLSILADVALRPTFPAAELERQRRQRLTALAQQHDEARIVAQALFARTLFGEGHPYGRRSGGVEQSLRSFAVDDLRGFYRTYFRPGNAALVVVGDVSARAILPRLEAAFGRWEGATVPAPRWPEVAQVRARAVYLVDKPAAAQSEVIIGRVGVPRSSTDYYALVVMNTILGASFSSRLNQNLREEKGYTYGAASSFGFDRLAGPFAARAAVHTQVTDKALTEFFKELTNIRTPVPAAELARAKNFVALRFPERFQAVAQIARQLGDLVVYDLPLDYFNTFTQRILAVTAAEVQRVARQYVDPERVVVVVVGDRAKVEAGIRALNLGPVQTLTIDDVLGAVPVVGN